MDEFFKRRAWLTLDEAASELSTALNRPTTAAELLRLALDGHLQLSVNIPAGGPAWRCSTATAGRHEERGIVGVWDLVMEGAGREDLEFRYHQLRGLPCRAIDGRAGATVTRDGVECSFRGEPAVRSSTFSRPGSSLPDGATLVIRMEVFKKLREQLEAAYQTVDDEALETRERDTLLTVIAAMAEDRELSITEPAKSAAVIENMTQLLGVRVSARRIADFLNRSAKVLEKKGVDVWQLRKRRKDVG